VAHRIIPQQQSVHIEDCQTSRFRNLVLFLHCWSWGASISCPGKPRRMRNDMRRSCRITSSPSLEFHRTMHFLQDGTSCHASKRIKKLLSRQTL
jgi:hypothetical protein